MQLMTFYIQIHLMLLFNVALICASDTVIAFKYISCYYLTIAGKWGNGEDRNSNTSHVII